MTGRRLLFVLLVIVVLGGAHASSAQTPNVPPPSVGAGFPTGTGIIRGRIARAGGRPLARVMVDLRGTNGVSYRALGLTDADGRYEFPALPAGAFSLVAHKSGYVELEFGQKRAGEPGTPITLAAGATREKLDMTLPRGSAIAGQIVDEDGDPVGGATVQVQQVRFGLAGQRVLAQAPVRRQITDDTGRYRLYGLPPGSYYVSASLDAGAPTFTLDPSHHATAYFPGTTSPADARAVEVGLSQDFLDVDFTLPLTQTVHVSGTVFDASGQPFRGAVFLGLSARSHTVGIQAERAAVAPDGRFDFPAVVPGDEYTLQAFPQPAQTDFAMQFVTVTPTSASGIELHMSEGYTVTGHVTLDGDAGTLTPSQVSFSALPLDFDRAPSIGNGGAHATVHDDWTFEVTHLFGPRALAVTTSSNWSVQAVRVRGIDVTDLPLESDARNTPITDVEVVLTNHAAQISGTVVDAQRQPVTDYSVIVFPADRARWSRFSRFWKLARPTQDGTFTALDLPPGEYLVAAVDHVEGTIGGGEWQDPQLLETLAPRATRVVVTEGQHVTVTPTLAVRGR